MLAPIDTLRPSAAMPRQVGAVEVEGGAVEGDLRGGALRGVMVPTVGVVGGGRVGGAAVEWARRPPAPLEHASHTHKILKRKSSSYVHKKSKDAG